MYVTFRLTNRSPLKLCRTPGRNPLGKVDTNKPLPDDSTTPGRKPPQPLPSRRNTDTAAVPNPNRPCILVAQPLTPEEINDQWKTMVLSK